PVHTADHKRSRTHSANEWETINLLYGPRKAYTKEEACKRSRESVGHHLANFLVHRFCVGDVHYGDMVHPAPRQLQLATGRQRAEIAARLRRLRRAASTPRARWLQWPAPECRRADGRAPQGR